jgi:LmbE family N-acetylglucosaminyl deacetylase
MMNKVIMAIFPHADDAAGMCGGTLAKFAQEGWRVILVRVTNDDKDSMNLPTREETERVNTMEFQAAARILGAAETVDLGFVTDVLGDVSMVALRERIVYMYRKYKPYAVFSFDPYAPYEPNLDHVRVAQAVEEGFWVSNFHLHYPEHLEQGFMPHAVCERWYFARVPLDPNYVVDITDQLQLQLKTWGRRVPAIDEALQGDFTPLIDQVIRENARYVAKTYGLEGGEYGEIFRVNRFGAFEEMFQALSEPLPGEPLEMHTRPCFDPHHQGPRLHN